MLLHKVPKYGNDVAWVDEIGANGSIILPRAWSGTATAAAASIRWGFIPSRRMSPWGRTSAHRRTAVWPEIHWPTAAFPPCMGRDTSGPTALLQSVARLPFRRASNGTLLNMKFLPAFFQTDTGIRKFTQLLRAVCALGISHIQFNVLNEADLRAAQREPEK